MDLIDSGAKVHAPSGEVSILEAIAMQNSQNSLQRNLFFCSHHIKIVCRETVKVVW